MRIQQSEFFGVDVDDMILRIAEAKREQEKLSINIQKYDGDKLPYPDNHFDRVMSSLVFHHLTLRQKYSALEEIHRILKPSCEIHIADFGKPANYFQRVGFYGVQLLDGFETTNDNLRGLLPQVMKESDFIVQEVGYFKTAVGTVRLIKGTRI